MICADVAAEAAEHVTLPSSWVKFDLWPETTVYFDWKNKHMSFTAPLDARAMVKAIQKMHNKEISADVLEKMVC